jgi:hypothetical protein
VSRLTSKPGIGPIRNGVTGLPAGPDPSVTLTRENAKKGFKSADQKIYNDLRGLTFLSEGLAANEKPARSILFAARSKIWR